MYTIDHCLGKSLYLADILSGAPLRGPMDAIEEREGEQFLEAVIASMPAKEDRWSVYTEKA